uniref:Uncharacterized protein n=1 Tax=viral metagenome TaxID=1070528 RepID=A0A6C0AMG2_9ZZZZ
MPVTLNSNVYVIGKDGIKETKTIREVIADGEGKTYDYLTMLPFWNDIMAMSMAEQGQVDNSLEEKMVITTIPLPPSPLSQPEVSDIANYDALTPLDLDTYVEIIPETQVEPLPDAQPFSDADSYEESPISLTPPRSPYYNHHLWPSPLAKVFVQKKRSKFLEWRGSIWTPEFKRNWQSAGNTLLRLTHDNCIRYLAHSLNCSVDHFLKKSPTEVNTILFGEYAGVNGYYTMRYY